MKYVSIFRNWRIVALTVMAMVAMLLIMLSTEVTTAAGVTLMYAAWRIGTGWQSAGLLDELQVFNYGDMEV